MIRAASLPWQQLSRRTVRVLSVQCPAAIALYHTSHLLHYEQASSRASLPNLKLQPPDGNTRVSVQCNEKSSAQVPKRTAANHHGSLGPHAPTKTTDLKHQFFPSTQPSTSSISAGIFFQSHPDFHSLYKHLEVINTTRDVVEAWQAYQAIIPRLPGASPTNGEQKFLYPSLHRLLRLLTAVDPRTRVIQLRIVSVMCALHNFGGKIHDWERRLLKTCVQANDIRPSDVKGSLGVIDAILLGHQSGQPSDEAVNVHHGTLDGEIMALLDKPLSHYCANTPETPILVPPIGSFRQDLSERAGLLYTIATTQSFSDAWDAYRAFLSLPVESETPQSELNICPERHLHRLVSLLATVRPRTRTIYISLVSILSTMREHGYPIRLWEWNLLIDCSVKGWRKMRQEDYKTALRVYGDMLNYQADMFKGDGPATCDQELDPDTGTTADGGLAHIDDSKPDIYTYTTLISHAARTLYPKPLQHAKSLLYNSKLVPNRITLLSQMRYYTMRNEMFGIRRIIAQMRDCGYNLGNDGMNSCIWAFARNQHMDVAEAIYRLLRHNVVAEEPDSGPDGIAATARFLDEMENIVVPPTIVPDRITYTLLVQCHAYQGNLTRTLQIFMDMLSSPDPVAIWRGQDTNHVMFTPLLPIYRAIFLGFYRHGVDPRRKTAPSAYVRKPIGKTPWNADILYILFQSFLELPEDQRPGDRVIYWLIAAFAKGSGYDTGKLRKIWKRVEQRFGNNWGHRLRRIRKSIYGNTEHTKAENYEMDEEDVDTAENEDEDEYDGWRVGSKL